MNAFAGPGTRLAHAFFHFVLLKSAKKRPAAFTRFAWDTTSWDLNFIFLLLTDVLQTVTIGFFCLFLCLKY